MEPTSFNQQKPTNLAEAYEHIRQTCAQHGEYYADMARKEAEIAPLLADAEDPMAAAAQYGQEGLAVAKRAMANEWLLEESLRGPAQATLRARKTSEVNHLSEMFADGLEQALGEDTPIDVVNAEKHTLFFAMGVSMGLEGGPARKGRKEPTEADYRVRNGIINQFSNELLARTDPNLLCRSIILPPEGVSMGAHAMNLARTYRQFLDVLNGSPVSSEFIAAKIMAYRYNVNIAVSADEKIRQMPETELSAEEVQTMRHNNNLLAGQMQRIKKYNAVPLVFPNDDVMPGTDLVTHDFSELNFTVNGEQPLALVRIVPSGAEDAAKVKAPQKQAADSLKTSQVMKLIEGELPITVDTKGELRLGMNLTDNSMNLRTFFERRGMADKYEVLRETVLAACFDASMPARIVNKIIAEAKDEQSPQAQPQEGATSPAVPPQEQPAIGEVLGRKALPRITYLRERTMGQIGKDFQQALAEEQAQSEAEAQKEYTRKKKHSVPGFERNLPKGAKGPSREALQLAREYYDDPDYILPPGKTFVRGHQRGLKGQQEIIGHVVTGWQSPQAKRVTGRSPNSSKKRRRK
ncbi:MAG TPA: hypothetical protein VFI74_05765 [Candidatus Saccharimonadales bacterium]|nr:hypothetical protein [Candidatus Saccharimonadales bacterium]